MYLDDILNNYMTFGFFDGFEPEELPDHLKEIVTHSSKKHPEIPLTY